LAATQHSLLPAAKPPHTAVAAADCYYYYYMGNLNTLNPAGRAPVGVHPYYHSCNMLSLSNPNDNGSNTTTQALLLFILVYQIAYQGV